MYTVSRIALRMDRILLCDDSFRWKFFFYWMQNAFMKLFLHFFFFSQNLSTDDVEKFSETIARKFFEVFPFPLPPEVFFFYCIHSINVQIWYIEWLMTKKCTENSENFVIYQGVMQNLC